MTNEQMTIMITGLRNIAEQLHLLDSASLFDNNEHIHNTTHSTSHSNFNFIVDDEHISFNH
jgi:hypothetical protein